MKILIIHYRYFIQGGPERYLFNVTSLLEEKGHTIIPFSVDYSLNEKSEYSKYFVKPVVDGFHISKEKISVIDKIKIAFSFFYNRDAKKRIKQLIKDTKPDVAYVLLYHGKLTYSVLEACKEMNLPIVHRISDFYHYCVRSSFFRDGKICTECINNPKACVEHRCVHGSKAKSILNYYIEKKERDSGIRNYISEIICPSSFTKKIFTENCIFPNAQISCVPTFFDFNKLSDCNEQKLLERKQKGNVCFIGRIAEEKGIDCLIEAWKEIENASIPCTLYLTGFFDNDYCKKIKEKISEFSLKNIKCFDFLTKEQTFEIIDNSFVSIIPSVWYDNMPNSFIESQAYSLPVIASDIGSLTELVTESKNGFLYEPNNSTRLAKCIKLVYGMSDDEYIALAKHSKTFVTAYCSKEKHYEELIEILTRAVNARASRN